MRSYIKRARGALRSVIDAPSRARSVEAAPKRQAGDAARDAGQWSAAVAAYGEYLALAPSDFGIWVQYGHSLKEARRLAEAEEAYARALALKPRDADLLANYGHLKKMRDDLAGAARLYGLSAQVQPDPATLVELSSPALAQYLTKDDVRLLEAAAGKALAPRCEGLTLINSRDLVPLGDDRFQMITGDPWLQFHLDRSPHAGPIIGELELDIVSPAGGPSLVGQLFIDYGFGYMPAHCLTFLSAENGATVLRLAAPERIRSLRLDPAMHAGQLVIRSINYRTTLTPQVYLDSLLTTEDDVLLTTDDLKSLKGRLIAADMSADDAMSLTRSLSTDEMLVAMRYTAWSRRWIDPSDADRLKIAEMTAAMVRRPTFSFVMPVYNTPVDLLAECIDSLLAQIYRDFEICIADDNSPNPEVYRLLERYARLDSRVKIVRRAYNGHISAASNSAMELATGEFVVLVDHDDLIPDYALFVVAHYLNLHPAAQILFSDEDKISPEGVRFAPYFKGEFDPFLLYGHNMVSHLGVYSRELLESIGGFRLGLEGSQDYDLLLRAYETVGDDAVVHIPHVLYHWRAIPGSTAVSADQKGYAIFAARNAINAHFTRTGLPLLSVEGFAPGNTAVVRTRNAETSVSIIIPTRDGLDDLRACVTSILKFDHRATEIIIVDNGSEDPETLAYLEELTRDGAAKIIAYPGAFNFSDINNVAAAQASGDILCFLNNDTEVVSRDWIDRARTLLSLPDVGVVGARLLYPDGALQHFGVTVGAALHRVAAHPHCGQPGSSNGYFSKARLMQQFSAVTAACMFVTRTAFKAAGGFDPGLRVAYNDVDFCLKVRKAGLKIVGDPDILLVHKESRTRGSDADGEKARRLDAEAALMRERWGDILDSDPFYSPNHDLLHTDFTLANPPRIPMPWKAPSSSLAAGKP